jgi:hypothetical protein
MQVESYSTRTSQNSKVISEEKNSFSFEGRVRVALFIKIIDVDE